MRKDVKKFGEPSGETAARNQGPGVPLSTEHTWTPASGPRPDPATGVQVRSGSAAHRAHLWSVPTGICWGLHSCPEKTARRKVWAPQGREAEERMCPPPQGPSPRSPGQSSLQAWV